MKIKRLNRRTADKLVEIFYSRCIRVELGYDANNVTTNILIAKNQKQQELFRVNKEYVRNPDLKLYEHAYTVKYTVIKSGKAIATAALKDNDTEYETDFPERELYMLLVRKYKRQHEAAKCLGDAFLKALRDEQRSK